MALKLHPTEVRALFTYNPVDGILVRNSRASATPIRGKQVIIDGVLYSTASVIWTYMTGEPQPYIIRIDLDHANNKWNNFRLPNAFDKPRIVMSKTGRRRMTIKEKEVVRRAKVKANKMRWEALNSESKQKREEARAEIKAQRDEIELRRLMKAHNKNEAQLIRMEKLQAVQRRFENNPVQPTKALNSLVKVLIHHKDPPPKTPLALDSLIGMLAKNHRPRE
jgi:hypothetical protein